MSKPNALAYRIAQAELIESQRQLIDLQRNVIKDLRAGLRSAHGQIVASAFQAALNKTRHPGQRVR